ncbi:hypothetical protein NDU88_000420 [Pleurodeles waltl]|uniref:Uncharacterized protein n=1 Tax=Pleurodeles waltl TaxID=8319 RepID=A0AAV7VWJ8_PLEWA|nr:hypothetical protein NDU88_000420 [Pleurodeles waltl]
MCRGISPAKTEAAARQELQRGNVSSWSSERAARQQRVPLRGNAGRASNSRIAGLVVSCKVKGAYSKKVTGDITRHHSSSKVALPSVTSDSSAQMEQAEQMVQGVPTLQVEGMAKEDAMPPGFEMIPQLELGCNSQGGSMGVTEDSEMVNSFSPGRPRGEEVPLPSQGNLELAEQFESDKLENMLLALTGNITKGFAVPEANQGQIRLACESLEKKFDLLVLRTQALEESMESVKGEVSKNKEKI